MSVCERVTMSGEAKNVKLIIHMPGIFSNPNSTEVCIVQRRRIIVITSGRTDKVKETHTPRCFTRDYFALFANRGGTDLEMESGGSGMNARLTSRSSQSSRTAGTAQLSRLSRSVRSSCLRATSTSSATLTRSNRPGPRGWEKESEHQQQGVQQQGAARVTAGGKAGRKRKSIHGTHALPT